MSHGRSATADMMHHVMAKTGGVNTKFKVGKESRPRVSRVKLKRPTLVVVLPGSDVHSPISRSNDRKTAHAKVTKYVQWYDPAKRSEHRMNTRPAIKGITGKLEYQGHVNGRPIWK